MINVSNEFFQTMEKRRNFTEYATVTLASGDVLTLTESDFTVNNNSFTEAAGGSGLPLGEAICKTIQLEIANFDEAYSSYDFVGAKIALKLRFKLSSTTESFDIGKFTVVDPATYGETIIITALDDMRKSDKNYNTDLAFPATAKNVLADICRRCEITLATTSFTNDSFVIQNRPSGNYHFRTVIGYIAMIAGGNAKINRSGALEIMSYDFTALEDLAVRGGTFSPWTSGDTLSGGTLNPWTTGDTTSGGDFVGKSNYHLLKNFKNLKVDTDEIEITGVSMTIENDMGIQDLISGTEGYVLNIDNPLLAGKEEEGLALIASVLVGGKMRKFEGDHIAYPLAEFMDPCLVIDKKGNMYPSVLTDIDFEFFGFTKFKNSAASKESLKSKASSKYQHELIKVEKKAEDLVEAEKTAREEAIKNLNNSLGDSSGMYVSDVRQSDGSTIRYLHDRPSLAESTNVIKITAEAIGISNDGGATYPYGFTLNGETITKYLYAEGIDADYITVGRISDATGQNYWDLEKGELVIKKATIDGSLISVTVTADQLTTGKIQDSTGANYWDMDSGEMVITNATIENIDADEISTGRISDKKGNNYWDMDSGEMVINKATINTSLNADKITAGTLSVERIDLDELFSQEITATNLTLTGASKFIFDDTYVSGSSVTIDSGTITMIVDAGDRTVAEHSGLGSTYYNVAFADGNNSETRISDWGLVLEKRDGNKIEITYNQLYGHSGATLDWRGPVKFSNSTLADFVVEQGTSGIWSYRKWSSGIAECWGRGAFGNIRCTTEYYGTYYGQASAINFPSGLFLDAPSCQCTAESQYVWVTHDKPTSSAFPTTYFYSPNSGTYNISVNLYAVGKWK